MARKSGASSTMGSAPTVNWVFSSPVPVLEVLVLVWLDPPQATVAHNVANPAAMMQAVLRRGNIMTLLAGRNSQKGGVNHTCVVPVAGRMSATCGGTPTLAEIDAAVTVSDLYAVDPAYQTDGPLSRHFAPARVMTHPAPACHCAEPNPVSSDNSRDWARCAGGRPMASARAG